MGKRWKLSGEEATELNLLVTIIVAGLLASATFHIYKAFFLGMNAYPDNTFLFRPGDRFNDFNNIYNASKGLNPFRVPESVYAPFTYVVMYASRIFRRSWDLIVMLTAFSVFVWWYVRQTVSRLAAEGIYLKTFALAFLTYPFLFVFDRANLEALVFIALAMFLRCYEAGEDRKGVFWLSAATAIKMYPGVFVVLYLARRKYRAAAYTALLTGALTLFSMLLLKGGMMASLHGFLHNLAGFRGYYFVNDAGLQHNLSLFGVLRLGYGHFCPGTYFPANAYAGAMMLMFLALAAYVVFIEKLLWRAVALLTFFILVAPQVSFDYKLIHLLLPVTLFLVRKTRERGDRWILAGFALLCVPKDYLLLRGDISIAVLLNPVIMLALTGALLWAGLRDGKATA